VLTLKVQNPFEKTYCDESAGFSDDINLPPGSPRKLTLFVEAFLQ
jgi:hypothetical protein